MPQIDDVWRAESGKIAPERQPEIRRRGQPVPDLVQLAAAFAVQAFISSAAVLPRRALPAAGQGVYGIAQRLKKLGKGVVPQGAGILCWKVVGRYDDQFHSGFLRRFASAASF